MNQPLPLPDPSTQQPPSVFEPLDPCPNPKGITLARQRQVIQLPASWRDRQGQQHVYRCAKNSCPTCRVINARRIAFAIAHSRPTHEFTLTHAGANHAAISRNVNRWAAYVRSDLGVFEIVWAAEANPSGHGAHVHGYAHTGSVRHLIREAGMERACLRAGLGRRWELKRLPSDAGARYCSYPMKSLAVPELVGGFLNLNGSPGRSHLIHASRAFWRDGPRGEVVTRAQAEKLSYERKRILSSTWGAA